MQTGGQCGGRRDHFNFIRQCFSKLGEDKDILIRGDVFRFIKRCHEQFDFIFADPPYALKELPKIPDLILDGDLLANGGIFVFEHGKNYDFSAHERLLSIAVMAVLTFRSSSNFL